MNYPTLEEVEAADLLQICKWMRFLLVSGDPEEQKVIIRMCERRDELGGITPAISKQIGWDETNN
ncbi:hypothetical protein OAC88_02810 [Flavobacteriaceae bacterium]|nr:hypothetical protein [Flavobacteriaceae bacterium]